MNTVPFQEPDCCDEKVSRALKAGFWRLSKMTCIKIQKVSRHVALRTCLAVGVEFKRPNRGVYCMWDLHTDQVWYCSSRETSTLMLKFLRETSHETSTLTIWCGLACSAGRHHDATCC